MRKFAYGVLLLGALAIAVLLIAQVSTNKSSPSPPQREYIGTASIDNNGTITLHLDGTADAIHAFATFTYKKNDPNYQAVLDHLQAGLKSGETFAPGLEVLVKPWPGGQTTSLITNDLLAGTLQKSKPTTVKVDKAGKVSSRHVERVQSAVDAMPLKIRKLLDNNGVRIIAANYVTDALSGLKGQQPRGYPPGSTWDNADGIFHGWQTIVVAEHHIDKDSKKETDNRDPEGVTRHEIGHAVNAWLGDFAQSKTFSDAYAKDIANIPADAQELLKYFLQSGEGGKSETFAEVFASLNGGVSRPRFADYIPKYFPETAKAIQKKLDSLK